MKFLIVAALALLPSVALAQWPGQCAPGQNPNTLGCAPAANTPISTDLVWGWQQSHSPHTVAMQVGQLFAPALAGGITAMPGPYIGPTGDHTPMFNGSANRFNFTSQILSGNPAAIGGPVWIDFENYSNGAVLPPISIYPAVPAVHAVTVSRPGSNGSLTGLWSDFYSGGQNAYVSQDVAIAGTIQKYGQNSTWTWASQSDDVTGQPPGAFAQVGMEVDLLNNGPDSAQSEYNPTLSNRYGILIAQKVNPIAAWAANTQYGADPIHGNNLVQGTTIASVLTVFYTSSVCTTGGTQPTWPNSGTVTDGTCTWNYGTPYAGIMGTGLEIGQGPVNDGINTVIGMQALIYNAGIDMTESGLAGTNPAAIRLKTGFPIDWSATGVDGTKNLHTTAYSGASGGFWYYNVGTATMLSITDAGTVSEPGLVSVAFFANSDISAATTAPNINGGTFAQNRSTFHDFDIITTTAGLALVSQTAGTLGSTYFTVSPSGISIAGTAAVSCTGVPTSGFVVTDGIVTHC